MKKAALIMFFLSMFSAYNANAYWVPPTPPVAVIAPDQAIASPHFFPFASAVGFAAFVIWANANGVQFPLCGVNGWQCYAEYPSDKNGG